MKNKALLATLYWTAIAALAATLVWDLYQKNYAELLRTGLPVTLFLLIWNAIILFHKKENI